MRNNKRVNVWTCMIVLLAIACQGEFEQVSPQKTDGEVLVNPYVKNRSSPSSQGRVNPYLDGVEGGVAQNIGPVVTPAGGFIINEDHSFAEGEEFYVDVVLSNNNKIVFFLTGTDIVVAKGNGVAERPESITQAFVAGGIAYAWGSFDGEAMTWMIAFREMYVEIVPGHVGQVLTTEITGAPPADAYMSNPSISFTFVSNDPAATFECSLDDGTPVPCISPVSYTGLPDGQHHFAVYAVRGASRDDVGAHYSWTVDTSVPYLTMTSAATTSTTLQVDFSTSEETNAGMLWGDRSAPAGNSIPVGSTYQTSHTIVLSGLSPSTVYYFQFFGYDRAGNAYSSPRFSVLTKQAQ